MGMDGRFGEVAEGRPAGYWAGPRTPISIVGNVKWVTMEVCTPGKLAVGASPPPESWSSSTSLLLPESENTE